MLKKIRLSSLTGSEKYIYKYLNDNFYSIPMLGIEDIVKHTFTSNSCVIRLSKKLGYSGWKQLQISCLKKINKSQKVDDSIKFDVYMKSIKKMSAKSNNGDFDKIISLLSKTKKIWVYGSGINKPIATMLNYQLLMKGKDSRSANCSVSERTIIKNLKKPDVVIFISYSGETKKVLDIVKLVNKGVKKIALTQNFNNPLRKMCDYELLVPKVNPNYDFSHNIVKLNKIILLDLLMSKVK